MGKLRGQSGCFLSQRCSALPGPAVAQNMDVFTRAVAAYELSLPKVEACARAQESVAEWAAKLESVPGIKRLLDQQQLTGKDFALIPIALLSSRAAQLISTITIQPNQPSLRGSQT